MTGTSEPLRTGGRVSFFVVGSPRSGTTLVQRLACELPGVKMPPETHFFSQFAAGLLRRRNFPVGRTELAEEISTFAKLETSRGMSIDVDRIVSDLGGSCSSPFEMFDAIVRHVAGPAEVTGEKTPNHLLCYQALFRAAPWLKFIGVVRDPRSVVASNLSMPWRDQERFVRWGEDVHLAFATQWSIWQQKMLQMSAELGPERCIVVRYEDVVADPDAARRRIAVFLGRPADERSETPPAEIVLPWEDWKNAALGDVVTDRVTSWGEQLTAKQAAEVLALCRSSMCKVGYREDAPNVAQAIACMWRPLATRSLDLVRFRRGQAAYARSFDGWTL